MAEKKKSTPKTPFEKIGAAYESEARRQEKSGNTEMATRTRQAAAKSMTKDNQKAFEEDTQAAKERKMASKKPKAKGKTADKPKTDAVGAAGAKAKNAVDAAVERNPVSGPPSPAGAKDNTGSGTSTQRTPKPSKNDKDGTPFDGDAYAKSDEGKADRTKSMAAGKNKSSLRASEDADARTKAQQGYGPKGAPKSPLRAGPEGTSGMSKGTKVGANDITKEMPATARDKDAERTSRIKELSGVSTDPSDKGKMPDAPPRTKPTVLITPSDKGKMPDPDKPGFMSRLRGRVKSFTTPAAGGAPPAPPATPSAGGAPPTPPSGGGYPDKPKAAEPAVSQTQETKDGTKQTQSAPATSSGITFAPQAGGNVVQNSQYTEKGDNNKDVTQTITGNGQPITATTSGKATSSGGRGITASTSGTATSHPRAANATRGGRPTSKKK